MRERNLNSRLLELQNSWVRRREEFHIIIFLNSLCLMSTFSFSFFNFFFWYNIFNFTSHTIICVSM